MKRIEKVCAKPSLHTGALMAASLILFHACVGDVGRAEPEQRGTERAARVRMIKRAAAAVAILTTCGGLALILFHAQHPAPKPPSTRGTNGDTNDTGSNASDRRGSNEDTGSAGGKGTPPPPPPPASDETKSNTSNTSSARSAGSRSGDEKSESTPPPDADGSGDTGDGNTASTAATSEPSPSPMKEEADEADQERGDDASETESLVLSGSDDDADAQGSATSASEGDGSPTYIFVNMGRRHGAAIFPQPCSEAFSNPAALPSATAGDIGGAERQFREEVAQEERDAWSRLMARADAACQKARSMQRLRVGSLRDFLSHEETLRSGITDHEATDWRTIIFLARQNRPKPAPRRTTFHTTPGTAFSSPKARETSAVPISDLRPTVSQPRVEPPRLTDWRDPLARRYAVALGLQSDELALFESQFRRSLLTTSHADITQWYRHTFAPAHHPDRADPGTEPAEIARRQELFKRVSAVYQSLDEYHRAAGARGLAADYVRTSVLRTASADGRGRGARPASTRQQQSRWRF